MLNVIVAIPMGDPDTIEIRPKAPEGTVPEPLDVIHADMVIQTEKFLAHSARDISRTFFEPAIRALQQNLLARGFHLPAPVTERPIPVFLWQNNQVTHDPTEKCPLAAVHKVEECGLLDAPKPAIAVTEDEDPYDKLPCRWCGKTYAEHTDDSATTLVEAAKAHDVSCLMLRSGFLKD